jgi:hypothetical protein
MKQLVRLAPLAAALSLLLTTGCSQSTAPGVTVGVSQSTSTALASAAMGSDLQVADASLHGGCNGVGLPLRIPPTGCPYDAGTGWSVCTSTGAGGITRTLRYQFRDAGGAAQPAFDDTLTASIEVQSTIIGTTRRNGHTRTVDDHRDLIVSGLAGEETTRTWNGTGSTSHSDSSGAGLRTVQSNTTVADVVVPAPFTRDSWPLSGTITTHLVTSSGVDVTLVLTFNGTRYASLTVNGVTTTVDLGRWLHRGDRTRLDDDDRDDHDAQGEQGDDDQGPGGHRGDH